MMELAICGGLGLLYGLAVQKGGYTGRRQVRQAITLQDRTAARTWVYALGLGMMLTAVLCWLAVIDVDLLLIMPLNARVLMGGVLAGVGLGLAGAWPGCLVCGVGGGRMLQSLCGLLGCMAALLLTAVLPMDALLSMETFMEGTLFSLTLRDAWLFAGGPAGLACLGALVCVLALLIRTKAAEETGTKEIVWQFDAAEDEQEETAEEAAAKLPEQSEADTSVQEEPAEAAMPLDEVQARLYDAMPMTDAEHYAVRDEMAAAADDELQLLDGLEDAVEELIEPTSQAYREAMVASLVTSAEPAPVDDQLPETEPLPAHADAWLDMQRKSMPSPMEDEALQEATDQSAQHEADASADHDSMPGEAADDQREKR